MREFIDTVEDELRRISAEGGEFVALDDDSVRILKKLASGALGAAVKSAEAPQKPEQEFVDDIEEVKFISDEDMGKIEKTAVVKTKKIKVVARDAGIAPIPSPKPFDLPEGDKQTRWEALRNIVLSDPVCAEHLHAGKKIVFGTGSLDAKIFFCGEAPGADEETQGEPFVGKAGQLLNKIISAMGLSREEVYIGNIMNWRPETPHGNRPPEADEMAYCLPYLKAQVEIVKPQILVALGMTAVRGLLGADKNLYMGKIHGVWQKYGDTDLMCTYHPSYLLQYATPKIKRTVWEDMMLVMERAGLPISAKQRGYFLPKE